MSAHQAANSPVNRYLNDIHRVDLLTREEEADLARCWVQNRDPRAAEELISRNLRFVVKVAMGYRKYRLPMADLIQEGNLGLIRAVEKFDPDKGTRLISYAVWWIKAFIQAHIIRSWSMVRVGTTQNQRRLFYKLPGILAEQQEAGKGGPNIAEIAEELGTREEDVVLMMNALRGRDLSLDAPIGDEGSITFGDRMADPGMNPEGCVAANQDQQLRSKLLSEAIACLPERQRQIIELRHRGSESLTLREVGQELGLSRERVRQLEARAMRRLRALIERRYMPSLAA